MHDLATVTVTQTFASPTGSVTFRFYTSSDACTADTAFTAGTTKGTIALVGNPGVAHRSTDVSGLVRGRYSFKANWPGDTTYSGSTSSCELFTVTGGTSS